MSRETTNKASHDVSVNYRDILRRLSIHNEEVVVQSPICKKVLSRPFPPINDQPDSSFTPKEKTGKANSSPRGDTQLRGSLESINSATYGQGWHHPEAGGSAGADSSGSSGGNGLPPSRGSGLTMKEYDQHLARLNKENFALKLRIYFMEEQGQGGQGSNVDVRVENESLKRQLYDKQQLVSQASRAMLQMEEDFKEQMEDMEREHQLQASKLKESAAKLQKELESYAASDSDIEKPHLTQLCDLAFAPNWDSPPTKNKANPPSDGTPPPTQDTSLTSPKKRTQRSSPVHITTTNVTNNNLTNSVPNSSNNVQQLQYQTPNQFNQYQTPNQYGYSTPEYGQHQEYSPEHGSNPTVVVNVPEGGKQCMLNQQSGDAFGRLQMVEAELRALQERLLKVQADLLEKEKLNLHLKEQIDALSKEVQEKERDVVEREEKLETLSQELETRHLQIQSKDDTISSLHSDLDRVEPEISVKVQEIIERDRIIEAKIEQIEQQNKILVEIQITLDEKQKQIAELESSLSETRSKVIQMEKDYNKSCEAINVLMNEKDAKDKEILSQKKDLKKKDHRIKDLMAELRETLDSLAKAQWEAENVGNNGEDNMKEMLEEENERLWADVEQKKAEIQKLQTELARASDDKNNGTDKLEEANRIITEKESIINDLKTEADKLSTELDAQLQKLEDLQQELAEKENMSSDSESGELEQMKVKLEELQEEKMKEIKALRHQLDMQSQQVMSLQSKMLQDKEMAVKESDEQNNVSSSGSTPLHLSITTGFSSPQNSVPQPSSEVSKQEETNSEDPIISFQKQVENLRSELKHTRNAIGSQISNVKGGKKNLHEVIRKYQSEVLRLRKKLTDSNNSCELMKNRLEELADFLEKILELGDEGLIDVSKISGWDFNHLSKVLDDSRQLSQSFSLTAYLEEESVLGDCTAGEESILPDGSCDVSANFNLSELNESVGGLEDHQFMSLCNAVDQKANQLDDILVQFAKLSEKSGKREELLRQKDETVRRLQLQLSNMTKTDNFEAECQTLLTMPPHQTQVSSLAELSTPFITSCSESLPVIKENHMFENEKAVRTNIQTVTEPQPASRVQISPSESEAWSEPDRNVSMARIGLDTCSMAVSKRQTRVSAALSSESDTEEAPQVLEDSSHLNTSLLTGSNKYSLRRRSDASEVRRLSAKLRTLEHLNETLRAELNIYQSLSNQLSATTDQQQSDSGTSFTRSPLLSAGEGASMALKKIRRGAEDSLALATPLLQEIRSLRSKLEESISNNDQLRDQLEAAVLTCSKISDDPTHLTHLTTALLNAQETLQLTRDKLSFAEKCEQVQADRCTLAETRQREEQKSAMDARNQLRDLQVQLASSEAEVISWKAKTDQYQTQWQVASQRLTEATLTHGETQKILQTRLDEIDRARSETEETLKAQHNAISEMYCSLKETTGTDDHLTHLHSALQASETQVLKVTRDRLSLLGEKTKLQAMLMTAHTQTSLLQESLCQESESGGSKPEVHNLHDQLAKVLSAVKDLQRQSAKLKADNSLLVTEKAKLENKLSGYKAIQTLSAKSDITLESVNSSELLQKLSLLQENYTHLQGLYNQLQEAEQKACKELLAAGTSLQRAESKVVTLTRDYQERLHNTQCEYTDKLSDAEMKLSETQARAQQCLEVSERRLTEVKMSYEEQLKELKESLKEELSRKDVLLSEAHHRLQLSSAEVVMLKEELTEMRVTKTSPYSSDSGMWSENKENVNRGTTHNRNETNSYKSAVSPSNDKILQGAGHVSLGALSPSHSPEFGNNASGISKTIPVHISERNSLPYLSVSCNDAGHLTLTKCNSKLKEEVQWLTVKLTDKDIKLGEVLKKMQELEASKKSVEKAIYRQLNKTHQVLKKAKGNLQTAEAGAHHGKPDARN